MFEERIKYLLLFVLSFLFSFILFYVCQDLFCDEIWAYGFSYNISQGMIIYRDFNAVPMPLYFIIVSIFLKIFGNYIIVIHIFDSLLFSIIIVLLFKIIRLKIIILLPIFMFFWPVGYNLLCLLYLVLIIYLIHEKKDRSYVISFIVGICFITKQNVGLLLLLPCLFYSTNKLKTIISFLLPFLIISIYFIYHDAFYQFIDCCFLGLIDFSKNNGYNNIILFILFVVDILLLLLILIKNKFKSKELFYIFVFQFIMYPIFDIRHCICGFFMIVYLIIKRINNKHILFILSFLIWFLSISLFCGGEYRINLDNTSITYFRNDGEIEYLAETVKKYVNNSENFFFTGYYSYFIKLYFDIPISQYDLLLSGNVGSGGIEKRLNELDNLCRKEKCYFFTEKIRILGEEYNYNTIQYYEFYDYIVKKYKKVDTLFEFDVYTNFD